MAGSGRIEGSMAGSRVQLVVKTPHVQGGCSWTPLFWSWGGGGMLVDLLSTQAVALRVVTSMVEGVRRPGGRHVGERSRGEMAARSLSLTLPPPPPSPAHPGKAEKAAEGYEGGDGDDGGSPVRNLSTHHRGREGARRGPITSILPGFGSQLPSLLHRLPCLNLPCQENTLHILVVNPCLVVLPF